MRNIVLALGFTILCQTSFSAEIRLGPGTWHGTQVVTVVVAADGSQTVTGSVITILGGGAGPAPPVDPPPPAGTPIDKHREAVRKATTAVPAGTPNKANTQAAMAKLYTTVSGLPVTDRSQLSQATDVLFGAMNLSTAWATWKSAVDVSLAKFVGLSEAKAAWLATGEEVSR